MKVQELFILSAGEMGLSEDNAYTYRQTLVQQVNMLLSQLFYNENNIRMHNDQTLLSAVPSVTSETDDIPYNETLVRSCMVWGLAQKMALTDDDTTRAGYYGMRFAESAKQLERLIPEDVDDYYSTSGEEE